MLKIIRSFKVLAPSTIRVGNNKVISGNNKVELILFLKMENKKIEIVENRLN